MPSRSCCWDLTAWLFCRDSTLRAGANRPCPGVPCSWPPAQPLPQCWAGALSYFGGEGEYEWHLEVLSHKPGPPLQLANLVNRILPRPSIFGKGRPSALFLGPPTSLLRRGCPVLQVPYPVAHRGPTLAGAMGGGSERLSSPRSQNGPWRSSASSALLPHSHSTEEETEAQNDRAAPGLTVSEADSLRAALCPLRAWLVQAGPSLINLHHPPASPLRAFPLPLHGPNSQSGHTTGGPGSRQAARPGKGKPKYLVCAEGSRAQILALGSPSPGPTPGATSQRGVSPHPPPSLHVLGLSSPIFFLHKFIMVPRMPFTIAPG